MQLEHTTFILGLPGSGKSTLANKLIIYNPQFELIKEPFPEDLDRVYRTQYTNPFEIQVEFLKLWEDALLSANPNKLYIIDGSPILTVFMYGAYLLRDQLDKREELFKLYGKLYDRLPETFKSAWGLVISLSIEECYAQVLRRDRDGEYITLEYLSNLNLYFNQVANTFKQYGHLRRHIEKDYSSPYT